MLDNKTILITSPKAGMLSMTPKFQIVFPTINKMCGRKTITHIAKQNCAANFAMCTSKRTQVSKKYKSEKTFNMSAINITHTLTHAPDLDVVLSDFTPRVC